MLIAHTVLVAIGLLAIFAIWFHQIHHVTLEIHFHVHTHSPVKLRSRAVDVNIRNPGFYDLGDFLACFLIRGDANFGFVGMTRIEVCGDGLRKCEKTSLGELVEGVRLVCMFVGQRDTKLRLLACWMGAGFVWLGVNECLVQETVQSAVLGLCHNCKHDLLPMGEKLSHLCHGTLEVDTHIGV